MGALETKKLYLLSEWTMERCADNAPKNSWVDSQLESSLSRGEEARIRAKARQDVVLGRETWKIEKLAGPLKQELFEFIMKHDGGWEGAHVPKNLVPLLV